VALMLARFIRFYGVTDAEVMKMPARRFFVLHEKITQISSEEDMRALMNQHGKPQERLKELQKIANGGKTPVSSTTNKPSASIIHESPYAAQFEAETGDINATREQQKIAAEKLKAEWLAKQK
jgi:hypothetical protein